MNLFDRIKSIFVIARMKKQLKKIMAESKVKEKDYSAMTIDDLSALSDDELFVAATTRIDKKVDGFSNSKEGFESLNSFEKVVYALNWLEMEVNNGGLCQFFVNSSRLVAPYISEYMEIVSADEHKELFDNFINKSGIDLTNLTYFDMDDVSLFEEKYKVYPFEEYDTEYYKIEPLEAYLKIYIREYVKEF